MSELLSDVGSLASIVGLPLSLLQWFIASANEKRAQTIGDYLEWLRRQDQQHILAAIDGNDQALVELGLLIDEVKSSVVQAIVSHEVNSQSRHDEIKSLIDAFQILDTPRIQLSIYQSVQHFHGGKYHMIFQAVNESRCHATIERVQAYIGWGAEGGHIAYLQDVPERCPVAIPPLRGSATFKVWTNPIENPGQGTPRFTNIHIKLAQETGWRVFKLKDGDSAGVPGTVLQEAVPSR